MTWHYDQLTLPTTLLAKKLMPTQVQSQHGRINRNRSFDRSNHILFIHTVSCISAFVHAGYINIRWHFRQGIHPGKIKLLRAIPAPLQNLSVSLPRFIFKEFFTITKSDSEVLRHNTGPNEFLA